MNENKRDYNDLYSKKLQYYFSLKNSLNKINSLNESQSINFADYEYVPSLKQHNEQHIKQSGGSNNESAINDSNNQNDHNHNLSDMVGEIITLKKKSVDNKLQKYEIKLRNQLKTEIDAEFVNIQSGGVQLLENVMINHVKKVTKHNKNKTKN